jgi:hypothetical protein
MIFAELQRFMVAAYGSAAWPALLKEAALEGRAYLPVAVYPDEEAIRLVTAAAHVTGLPPPEILSAFGEFIAPDLLRMYQAVLLPGWKSLDVIEHTEEAIHKVVRQSDPKADPPFLRAERTGPDEVIVTYTSPRRLCHVAEGIAQGLGRHFGERLEVEQTRCTWRGDALCLIAVRRLPST